MSIDIIVIPEVFCRESSFITIDKSKKFNQAEQGSHKRMLGLFIFIYRSFRAQK